MHTQTEDHIEALLERACSRAIYHFEWSIARARNKQYALKSYVSQLKFSYSQQFAAASLNELIATQLDDAFQLGHPLRQTVKDLPSQVQFFEDMAKEIIHTGGSELLQDTESSFQRCVKLFIKYRCYLTLSEHISKKHHSEESLHGKTQAKKIPLKALTSRSKSDGKTKLSMEETLTLFKILREYKFILKDEYLDKTIFSEAIHAMSGYSTNTLRQNLSDPKYYSGPLLAVLQQLKFLTHKIEAKLEKDAQGDVEIGSSAKHIKRLMNTRGNDAHDPNSTVN